VKGAIRTEFQLALRRSPTDDELTRFMKLYEQNLTGSGHVVAGKAMLMAIVLRPEALFRLELGTGPIDEHGRRRLALREIAKAISFALDDRLDAGLGSGSQKYPLQSRCRRRRSQRMVQPRATVSVTSGFSFLRAAATAVGT